MGIIQKVRAWRSRRQPGFDDLPDHVSLDTRLSAAEYEFRQISRDVHAVLLDGPRTGSPVRHARL